jgi:hypothetical protein
VDRSSAATRSDVPPDPSPEDAPLPKPHYGRDDLAILAEKFKTIVAAREAVRLAS